MFGVGDLGLARWPGLGYEKSIPAHDEAHYTGIRFKLQVWRRKLVRDWEVEAGLDVTRQLFGVVGDELVFLLVAFEGEMDEAVKQVDVGDAAGLP